MFPANAIRVELAVVVDSENRFYSSDRIHQPRDDRGMTAMTSKQRSNDHLHERGNEKPKKVSFAAESVTASEDVDLQQKFFDDGVGTERNQCHDLFKTKGKFRIEL